MSLTNSQYDFFMREYEKKQLYHENRLRERFDEIYQNIPEILELDHKVSSLSLQQAQKLLNGEKDALVSLKKELFHLAERKKQLLQQSGYPVNYLEKTYTCPDCQDTGYIGNKKCHCFERAIIHYLYSQSNLQDILKEENFSTCSLDYYSVHHKDPLTGRSSLEAMQTALAASHHFVDHFDTDFQNIFMYGDTGVGKTFLSHCIAKELLDRSHSVIYFSASQLFDILAKNIFDKDSEASMIHEHVLNCDLLIIDDLGTELANAFTISQLFVCLNERLLKKKATLISTNLALEDIRTIYSERIFSRITSSYTILRMTGDDIRIKKKLMKKI